MISQRASYRPSHRHLVSSSHLVPVVVSSAAFLYRAPFRLLAARRSSSRRFSFRSPSRSPFRSPCRRLVLSPRFLDTGGGAFSFLVQWRASKQARERAGERGDGLGRAGKVKGMASMRLGVGKQTVEAGHGIGRYEDAPLILFDGRGVGAYRFFMRWGRGRLTPPSPWFFAIVPRSI